MLPSAWSVRWYFARSPGISMVLYSNPPSKFVEGDMCDLEGRSACLLSQKLGIAYPQPHSLVGLFCRARHRTRCFCKKRIERAFEIVGGAGHTTETLRQMARKLVPDIPAVKGATEAEIFSAYIAREGLKADILEMRSTNCGNNITFLKEPLEERRMAADSFILAQDATMERRMVAGLEKEMPHALAIAYATYAVLVEAGEEGLCFADRPLSMWDMERYLALLMGEIPRLEDGPEGYGPSGRGYLVHVDIPDAMHAAWERLSVRYPWSVRKAQSRYAAPLGK